MKPALYEEVTLRQDVPEAGLQAGVRGTLVDYLTHPSGGEAGALLELEGEGDEPFVVAVPLSSLSTEQDGAAAEQAAPEKQVDDYEYDVFISYRQREPDKAWVRKTLVKQLEAAGLRVFIDYRDFRLGAVLIKEMERAVVTSRYTLAVLSPAYLESNFTEFENLLAEHLGLEQSQRRLLMVMREACEPRLSLKSRLWLDMTDEEEFEVNLARLVQELRRSPEL